MSTTETITIAQAGQDDIPFMCEMMKVALEASPNFIEKFGLEKLNQEDARYWETWPHGPDKAIVAIGADGQLLGGMRLRPVMEGDRRVGWRLGIAVVAEARGRGVGERLIRYALDFARADCVSFLQLFVDPANERAAKLYRNLGFVEVGEGMGAIEMRVNYDRDAN